MLSREVITSHRSKSPGSDLPLAMLLSKAAEKFQMHRSPAGNERNDTAKMKQVLLLYDTYRIELANHKIDSGFQFYYLAAGLKELFTGTIFIAGCLSVLSLD